MMVEPRFLGQAANIGVMAPSSYVERKDLEAGKARLEGTGFSVFIHPQSYERDGQSAGMVIQKSMALQGLWQRRDVDAIWCAGGGNESLPLLQSINFDSMHGIAKPLIGFSDNTTLINAVAVKAGHSGLHAPSFNKIAKLNDAAFDRLIAYLTGAQRQIDFSPTSGTVISGRLLGGNLSLLQYLPSLLGGEAFDGAILALEDCGEELSRIDRMLSFLRASGVFDRIIAVLYGQFTDLKDTGRPFGRDIDAILDRHLEGLDIPVIKDLLFGHDLSGDICALPIGAEVTLAPASGTLSW